MANKRNKSVESTSILFAAEADSNEISASAAGDRKEKSFLSGLAPGERLAVIAVCLLVVVGALGAGLGGRIAAVFNSKNTSPKRNQSASSSSVLASLNPFAAAVTTATPQLSKEYIYAGSRMLAVEDANASALPPADLGVWRPSNGTWYVLNSSNQQWTTQQWGSVNAGAGSDLPAPGDFDGDGRTDFSVFRPSNGTWYIMNSSNAATSGYPFGQSGDIPAPADFDGDGKTDAAVYRPTTGVWYIVKSSTSASASQQLGTSGDVAAPGDFDGDGKADYAVWRESNLTFYVLRSSDGTLQTQIYGAAGDKPVVGDYDGDGKADYAVRHGNDWMIKYSAGRTATVTWQLGSDRAVQNDYDGDGKVDIAVWRESNGTWYIRNSRDSTTRTVNWGSAGDVPVPAFYRR